MIGNVVTTLSTVWNDQLDIQDLETFINDNSDVLQPVNATLQSALKNIGDNKKWMERNGQTFRNFIDNL